MNDRELLQIALDALHKSVKISWNENLTKECFNPAIEVIQARLAQPEQKWQGLTENEIKHLWYEACQTNLELTSQLIVHLARNIEAKLKEKNHG